VPASPNDALFVAAIDIDVAVTADIRAHKGAQFGRGTLGCPVCKHVITFTWEKRPSSKIILRAVCETTGCVRVIS